MHFSPRNVDGSSFEHGVLEVSAFELAMPQPAHVSAAPPALEAWRDMCDALAGQNSDGAASDGAASEEDATWDALDAAQGARRRSYRRADARRLAPRGRQKRHHAAARTRALTAARRDKFEA